MFSDVTIQRQIERGSIAITPRDGWIMQPEQWQPASVDLRIADCSDIESRADGEATIWEIPPHAFCLGSTIERVRLGRQVVGQVHGKSSWARSGLVVHAAGLVDPGFSGEITLELFNMTHHWIYVEAGKRIAQITFDWMDTAPDRVYGDSGLRSRYQGQVGPTPARGWYGDQT